MTIYHRYFTQYMLKNGVATIDDALNFCKHMSQGTIETQTQLKTLIIELNRKISKQFYKIVVNTCEVTNEDVVVWLNTKNDDISKHQITFSSLELEYFQAILQQILESDEYRITFIVSINITSTLTNHYTRDNGQKVLNKWLKGGYFVNHGEFIYLGPRTILEFTSYLRSHCPDNICKLCSELVFTGKQCCHCSKRLHSYCLAKYLLNRDECPCCKQVWLDLGGGQEQLNNANNPNRSMEAIEMENVLDEMALPSTSQQSERLSPVISHSHRRIQRHQESDQDDDESVKSGPSRRKRQK